MLKWRAFRERTLASRPEKKKKGPTYLPSFLLLSAKSHLPHRERASAFEACLEEKISFEMFSLGRTWGLGSSGKAQKKKWLGSNTIFQGNWNIDIVQK